MVVAGVNLGSFSAPDLSRLGTVTDWDPLAGIDFVGFSDRESPELGSTLPKWRQLDFVPFRIKISSRPLVLKYFKLKENHILDMRHAEIMALGKLYREGSTKNYDDRAAAIEVQVEQDIQLKKENLLGVVLPEEYLRTPGVRDTLKQLTNIIEPYGLLPLSLREHYSSIYQGVNQVYKKAGINI
jgi:hypothetical protein